jgi:uncharacterized membrane protein YgdD (TMEM256/DUF423 family)
MKNILSFAAISGFLCVAFGAFGAHGLKPLLTPSLLATFETAVRYQFYHSLALVLLVVLYQLNPNKQLLRSAYFFIAGIVLFSGSLYGLVFTSIGAEPWRWLGPVTPMGGISFMIGWVFLVLSAKSTKNP